jgi:Tol biopolymer transport system component
VCRTLVLTATVVLALVAACMAALVVAVVKPAEAAFPGRNGKIAFAGILHSETQTTNNGDIYTTRPGTFKLVNITNTLSAREFFPAWSPDGKKIVYQRQPIGGGDSDIYVMNARGKGNKRLTDSGFGGHSPAWSPDGSKIAFVSNRDPSGVDIYIMDADGGNVRRLTNNTRLFNERPSWSPDGTKIAFQSTASGDDDWEIYTINVDGTGETALTNNETSDVLPDWSPDGQRIAFNASNGIYVMNADGTEPRRVWSGVDPSWSPDGTKITFVTGDGTGNGEIATVNLDGSGLTFHTKDPTLNVMQPDWQPRP